MISDYPKTIQDYEDANQQIPLDSYAKYNKLLAQGIVKVHSKNYEEAINIFNVAEKTLSGSGINKI